MADARFALYWAPAAGSALDSLASAWLGRDARTGAPLARPTVAGWPDEQLDEITAAPRRYGFHATLKAPFRLGSGETPEAFLAAAARFADRHAPVALPPQAVIELGGFLALGPTVPAPGVDALAAACVADFDRFRAAPTEDEAAARSRGLTAGQRALLDRWGYPWVMGEHRFHMTLTNRLAPTERAALMPVLTDLFAPALDAPLTIDALSVFAQPDRATQFREVARLTLRAGC